MIHTRLHPCASPTLRSMAVAEWSKLSKEEKEEVTKKCEWDGSWVDWFAQGLQSSAACLGGGGGQQVCVGQTDLHNGSCGANSVFWEEAVTKKCEWDGSCTRLQSSTACVGRGR